MFFGSVQHLSPRETRETSEGFLGPCRELVTIIEAPVQGLCDAHGKSGTNQGQLGTDLWFLWRLPASRGEGKGQEDAQGSVSPFGFVLAEFGLQAPILQSFWRVFVFRSNGQKDARGLISPLWVHMEGV